MDLPLLAEPADPQAQARADRHRFRTAILINAGFVALLWWIRMLEVMLDQPLAVLGVRPGEIGGLIGLIAGPLIHGSTQHLVGNTLPLLVLGTLTFAVYPRSAWRTWGLIWLVSGLGIWWFGRSSTHIGASGLSHGLMFFLFLQGVLRRDRPAVGAALIAFFLYGGMLLTVLPGDPQVSWEAHLFGALAGAGAALLWRRRDPAPPRKRYSWEDEPDDELESLHSPLQQQERSTYELSASGNVPVLWQRTMGQPTASGVVVPFRPRSPDTSSSSADG